MRSVRCDFKIIFQFIIVIDLKFIYLLSFNFCKNKVYYCEFYISPFQKSLIYSDYIILEIIISDIKFIEEKNLVVYH